MIFKKIVTVVMLFSILTFSTEGFLQANAQDNLNNGTTDSKIEYNNKNVSQLADYLEVLDKSAYYDEDKKTVAHKESILKEELSSSDYNKIIGELKNENLVASEKSTKKTNLLGEPTTSLRFDDDPPKTKYLKKCVTNHAGSIFGGSIGQAAQDLIRTGDFKGAANRIIKDNKLKTTNAFDLAFNLVKVRQQCNQEANKKGL